MSSSCTPSSSSPSLDRVHSECPPPRKRLRTVAPGRFLPPNEIERKKAASLARLFESWANLEERYTRDLEEDDIVDLSNMTVIKDRGVLASSPVKQFGMRQALLDDGDDEGSENQDGSDNSAGTIDAPLASIQAAVDQASAGDTIYLREGTYTPTENIQIKKSGTSSAPYTISNYEGESVLIDGEELPYTPGELDSSIPSSDRGVFHVEADYWVFSGLEIAHGPYAIYADNSNNNIYRNLITRDNYETGLQIQGESSNNLVENLDSYGNHDPRKNGESADGLGVKEGSGEGNVIRGTRLWNNVDDGLDFWEYKSPVTIENTYSWGNGFNRWNFEDFEGDGKGFKLGGGDASNKGPAAHVVTNCIAFSNAAGGFVDNSQPGDMTLTRNTAWNNTRAGVQFDEPGFTVTLRGNIAVSNGDDTTLGSEVKSTSNSWDSGSWSDDSFASLDPSTLTGARLANGSVAASSFLLPAYGDAIGAYYF